MSLIVLPALVLGFATLRIVRESIIEQAESEQLLLLQAIKTNVVDRHVEDMENVLRTLAREPALVHIFDDPPSREKVVGQWELSRSIFPSRSWIYFGTPDSRILVNPKWDPPDGYDCTVRPWYTKARYADGIVWVEPYEEYITHDLVISASCPIHDEEGTFRGVLSIDTHLDAFVELLRHDAGNRSPQIVAVSAGGDTLLLNKKDRNVFDMTSLPEWNEIRNMDNDGRYLEYDGKTYYAVIVDAYELSLKLVSLLPADVVYEEIEPILWTILAVSLTFVAVSLLAGLYFSRHFLANIERLNAYMSAVESGDYRIRYCVSGRDEFRELNRRLNTMVHRLSEDIRSLEQESTTDPLCGIPNRRHVMEQLDALVDGDGPGGEPVSIALFDIDHFKSVNDTYGHTVGDEVLRRIGGIMRRVFPANAVVGRYGGEELIAILPGCTVEGAVACSETFRVTLERQNWRERGMVITISGGIAQLGPGDTVGDLIDRADQALYRAKKTGRNRTVRLDATTAE